MKKLLMLLDSYLLPILAGFLLVFIPLYPKIPLFDLLPGYIVRARLEDIFILLTVLVYGVYVLRGRVHVWNTPLTKPMLIYLVIGLISLITAIFVIDTIPLQSIHINKAVLHYFRRIEYFSLFFIFFSVSTSLKRLKVYMILFLITMALIALYGYGQKYLYWCAFSTMNREFSKGWCLYLTDHARVMSTFGGHYDLAAFTMMALTMLWSLFFSTKKLLSKIIIFALLGASFWLIILTASRVSFIAYIAALTLVVFIWMYRKGLRWGISRWFVAITLSILVMLSFGDLSERFLHLLKLDERLGGIKTLLLKPLGAPPEKGIPLAMNQDELSMVTSKSDEPPSTTKPISGGTANQKPSDVVEEQPDYTNIYTKEGKLISIPTKRTYSANALKFDLSTGIRLDYLWPKAWEGFAHDPLFGSGYSTLTKQNVTDFTEAESTDNGFLRALGETGGLGAIAFYAIIFTVLLQMWWALPGIKNPFFYASVVGLGAATVGLLLNNVYIDIFEASKVALPFWSLSGIVLGTIASQKKEIEDQHTPMKLIIDWWGLVLFIKKFLTSDLFILVIILLISFSVRMYRFDTPLADWHSWRQADTSSVTRNFIRNGMNFLYPTYDDLSSIASGKPNPQGLRMVEFPLYNAASTIVKKLFPEFNEHQSGRFTSILASLGSILFLFLMMRKYTNRFTAFLAALFFGIIPYNIYYSRVVLPEPTAVFAMLGMTYFFDRFLSFESQLHITKSKIKHGTIYIVALLFAISALLIKPPAGFYFLPLIYLVFRYKGIRGLFRPSIILFFVLSVVPLLWWRWWISHFPEGVPAYEWLLNGDGIRFKGAFFYWIFGDRIGRLILGYWALPVLIVGIIKRPKEKEGWFFYTWIISSLVYLTVFATGNVRHDYYQIFIIPTIAVFLAKGVSVLVTLPKGEWNMWLGRVVCGVSMILSLSIGWYYVRDYFNINHPEIIEAAEAVRAILKPKTLVVAPYGGDTAFLYQIDHPGWPIVEGTIEDMVKKGAHYYVSVQDDDATKYLLKEILNPTYPNNFKILERSKTTTDQPYTIIQLIKNEQIPK